MAQSMFSSSISPEQIQRTIFKRTALDEKTQSVLADVYMKLAGGCTVAAGGAYLGSFLNISGIVPILIAMFCTYMFRLTADTYENYNSRVGYYYAACGLYGMSLSALLFAYFVINPTIILSAVVMTALLFGSFTVAALTSRRREYLYLTGIVLTATSGLFWVGIANIFFRSPMIETLRLYGGLLVFTLWVLVDTQIIIDRVENGCRDVLRHAFELFLDVVNIFIHVLRILGENDKKKRDRNNNNN